MSKNPECRETFRAVVEELASKYLQWASSLAQTEACHAATSTPDGASTCCNTLYASLNMQAAGLEASASEQGSGFLKHRDVISGDWQPKVIILVRCDPHGNESYSFERFSAGWVDAICEMFAP